MVSYCRKTKQKIRSKNVEDISCCNETGGANPKLEIENDLAALIGTCVLNESVDIVSKERLSLCKFS